MSSLQHSSPWRQALLWGVMYWVVHLTMLTPLFMFTVWFAAVPAVLLYVKTNPRVFAPTIGAAWAGGMIIAGSGALEWIILTVFFLIPSIAMGAAYKKGNSARKAIMSGALAFLALFLLSVIVATSFGFNMNQAIAGMIRDGMGTLPPMFQEAVTEEAIVELVQLTTMMVPFYFIAAAFILSAITHGLSSLLCRLRGNPIPRLEPIREWKMRRSLVWVYLIVLLADLMVARDEGTFLAAVTMNLVPLLMGLFAIQGIAFLFFIAFVKHKAWIPWIGIVALFIIPPPLFSAFSLLGVFDTAFPIRDRFRAS